MLVSRKFDIYKFNSKEILVLLTRIHCELLLFKYEIALNSIQLSFILKFLEIMNQNDRIKLINSLNFSQNKNIECNNMIIDMLKAKIYPMINISKREISKDEYVEENKIELNT